MLPHGGDEPGQCGRIADEHDRKRVVGRRAASPTAAGDPRG